MSPVLAIYRNHLTEQRLAPRSCIDDTARYETNGHRLRINLKDPARPNRVDDPSLVPSCRQMRDEPGAPVVR